MSESDSDYSARKLRELLCAVARHIECEARELLSQAGLMEEEARLLLSVTDELRGVRR